MADTPDYDRPGAQPPPLQVADARSAHDVVCDDLISFFGPGGDVVLAVAGIRARKAYGLAKYGTVLHADNGRDHLIDILEESEDKAAYMATAMLHDPDLCPVLQEEYGRELNFLITLHGMIADRDQPLSPDDDGRAFRFPEVMGGGLACGARLRTEEICILPLEDGRCFRHGRREVES